MSLRVVAGRTWLAGLALLAAGCHDRWLFAPFDRRAPRPAEVLDWTPLATDSVDLVETRSPGRVRYRLLLPAGRGARERRLEVRFRERLEGAKVDARGTGPRHALTLLHEKRVGGSTVSIPLPTVALEAVDLLVHHHRRPLPLVAEARVGRAAGAQP